MICLPCRRRFHRSCANRMYAADTNTYCDCQHQPVGEALNLEAIRNAAAKNALTDLEVPSTLKFQSSFGVTPTENQEARDGVPGGRQE